MTEAVSKLLGRFERMELIDQYAFHRHIAARFTTTVGFPCYTTSNFDAMTRFLDDIGLQVELGHNQLCPVFNSARGAFVRRGNVSFNLEESSDGHPTTSFNLFLSGYALRDFERLDRLGYGVRDEAPIYGVSYTFISPDGGKVIIT